MNTTATPAIHQSRLDILAITGGLLKTLRENRHMSVQQAQELIPVVGVNLKHIEKSGHVSLEVLFAIAQGYQFNIAAFVQEVEFIMLEKSIGGGGENQITKLFGRYVR